MATFRRQPTYSLAIVTSRYPATCCICISGVAFAAHKDYTISIRDFRRCEANIKWKLSCIFRMRKSLDAKPFRVNLNCNEPIELAHSNLGINLKRCWSCVIPFQALSFSLEILICNFRQRERKKRSTEIRREIYRTACRVSVSKFNGWLRIGSITLMHGWKKFFF